MRILMIAAAAGLALPVAMAVPATKVEAKAAYGAAAVAADQRRAREWRGRDGRRYCRKPNGTTGLVVGGVAGALAGRAIDTRGDRTLGTVLGAAGGAVAGRAIERGGSRCR